MHQAHNTNQYARIIKDIIKWISAYGNQCTEAELRAYLESKGFSNSNLGEVDYIISQLIENGFSIMGGNVTYRGMNFIAPLPPKKQ